jgi:hypothetical protein
MNDNFYEASVEVYYNSVRQKLVILGFSNKTFFTLTSVTSETSWGQTMGFSDLTEVSNFSWRCQLLYEVLLVELGWKMKHPETAISQRSLLDTPCILNWPKSPHRLGIKRPYVPAKSAKLNFDCFLRSSQSFGSAKMTSDQEITLPP